jgi:hypothetical protein
MQSNEAALVALVRGELTLQAAFAEGVINLTGEPEPFLRLAMILDRASQHDFVGC